MEGVGLFFENISVQFEFIASFRYNTIVFNDCKSHTFSLLSCLNFSFKVKR